MRVDESGGLKFRGKFERVIQVDRGPVLGRFLIT